MDRIVVCKVGETAQKEVEKAPRTSNTVPRSFKQLFDELLQKERTTRRMNLKVKALVPLVCLFSMICNSTIFSFRNICCLYLILDLIGVAAELFGVKQPLFISLTLSELVDASIESEQSLFWQEYQGLQQM